MQFLADNSIIMAVIKQESHLIRPSSIGFAGLYDVWRDKQGKELKSYTFIATQPNSLVAKIHDRMPVILEKQDEETWLNP